MQQTATLENAPWEQPSPIRNEFGKLMHHARRAIDAGDTERIMQIGERLSKVEKWGQPQTDLYIQIAPHMPLSDHVMARSEKLNTELLNDWGVELEGLRAGWPSMSTDNKIMVMQTVLNRQMQKYGLENPPRVGLFDEGPEADGGVEFGHYDPRSHRVEINEDKRGILNNFDECMATIIHEGTHAVQVELGKMHKDGRIAPNHPLADTARVFALETDFINRCEDEGHYPGGDYVVMAAERHAYHADEHFTRQMKEGQANRMVRAMRRQMVQDSSATKAVSADADGMDLLGGFTASMEQPGKVTPRRVVPRRVTPGGN
ncbi:MAG: hypothetical protein Alpg2KO_32610 [Alphaproteobacteria bacterium]